MTHLIISEADIVVGILVVHHRSDQIVIIIVSNRSQSNCKVLVLLVTWPLRLTSSWCSVPRDLKSCMTRDYCEIKFTLSIDKRKQTSSYGTQPSGQNPDQFTGVSESISCRHNMSPLYFGTHEKNQVCESKWKDVNYIRLHLSTFQASLSLTLRCENTLI